MKSMQHYSKKYLGLDNRYWLLLLMLSLLSLIGWSFKKIIAPSCPLASIEFSGNYSAQQNILQTFRLNEQVTFKYANPLKQKIAWSIGEQLLSNLDSFTHVFNTPGKHAVKLSVGDKCTYYSVVQITTFKHVPSVLTTSSALQNDMVIEGNTTFEVGTITYFTTAVQASAYQWQILELPEFETKTDQTVGYSIVAPGQYTLQLILDGDATKAYTKTIIVTPPAISGSDEGNLAVPKPIEMGSASQYPNQPVIEDKSKPQLNQVLIPDNELLALFKLIRDEKKQIDDVLSAMCKGAQTKVLANDEKVMTLSELVDLLQSKKWALGRKPKVNSVTTVRDSENGNCVNVIYIKYK